MANQSYKIAVLPGDGIGPEVIDAALKVLSAVSKKFYIDFETEKMLAGGVSIDEYVTAVHKDIDQIIGIDYT